MVGYGALADLAVGQATPAPGEPGGDLLAILALGRSPWPEVFLHIARAVLPAGLGMVGRPLVANPAVIAHLRDAQRPGYAVVAQPSMIELPPPLEYGEMNLKVLEGTAASFGCPAVDL